MKITTRTTNWGIELSNDEITDDILKSSHHELKYTMINFLEAVKDISTVLNYHDNYKEQVFELTQQVIDKLEEI